MSRGLRTVGRRRRKTWKKFIGRLVLFFMFVALGISMYAVGKQVFGVELGSGSNLIVQEVPIFTSAAKEKEMPKEFNGMTRKVAYLTLDDGPNAVSNSIMDVLKRYHIKATYFMLGQQMNLYPDTVKRLIEEGHYPGLHSMTHDRNKLYNSGGSDHFIQEFQEAQSIVERLIGEKPTLIRAPYGSVPWIGESFRQDIMNAGFKLWDWTLDSLDWKFIGQPDRILEEIKRGLTKDVEVILLHDREQTLQALPSIIEYIQSQGYEFEVYDPDAHFICNFYEDKRL